MELRVVGTKHGTGIGSGIGRGYGVGALNIAIGAGKKTGTGTGRTVFDPPPVSTVSLSSSALHSKIRKNKAKSFQSHKAHRAVLISVSSAFSQAPVYTARPQIRG